MIPTKTYKISLILSMLLAILSFSCEKSDRDEAATDDGDDEPTMPIDIVGEIAFVKNMGGSDNDEVVGVVQASDGGYVLVGTTESTGGDIVDKTEDDADVWVVKTDIDGQILWSKTYGGSDNEQASSIQNTSDGGFIISASTRSDDGDINSANQGFNDLWILKLSGSGDILWENTYGFAGNDQAYHVIPTQNGGYLLSGVLDVTASGGAGNAGRSAGNHAGGDYWVIYTDGAGELVWSRYFGGTFTDTAYEAVETDNGDFIIIGSSDSTDVDIIDNKGAYDFWIIRINKSGDFVWRKNFGGSEIDLPYAITKTSDGNFIVAGDTRSNDQNVSNLYGNADVWLVKFDENGSIIWEKNYGGTQFESARDIVNLSNGSYAVVASSRSNDENLNANYGVNDGWLFIINEEGILQFQKNLGGSLLDFAQGVIGSTDGTIIVVGNTESSDGDLTQNKGGKDAFMFKIK